MKNLFARSIRNHLEPGKKEEGFALLDALIAVAVFAIGLLGAVQFIMSMQDQLILQKMELMSSILAQNKLEEADAVGYAGFIGTTAFYPASNDYNPGEGNYDSFEISHTGAEIIAGKAAKIAVSVRYTYKSRSATKTLTTIVMKR